MTLLFTKLKLVNFKPYYTQGNEKATEINPEYVEAHNNLGITLMESGKHQQALECFKKAVQINPNHLDSNTNLANILMEFNHIFEAKKYFEKALSSDPNKKEACQGYGRL